MCNIVCRRCPSLTLVFVCRRPEPTRKNPNEINSYTRHRPLHTYIHTHNRIATCYQLPAAAATAASSTSYATRKTCHYVLHTHIQHTRIHCGPHTQRVHNHPRTFYGSAQYSHGFYFISSFFFPLLFHHSGFGAQGVSSDFIYSVLSDSTIYLWMSPLHTETTFSLNLNAIKCRRRDWNRFSAMTM